MCSDTGGHEFDGLVAVEDGLGVAACPAIVAGPGQVGLEEGGVQCQGSVEVLYSSSTAGLQLGHTTLVVRLRWYIGALINYTYIVDACHDVYNIVKVYRHICIVSTHRQVACIILMHTQYIPVSTWTMYMHNTCTMVYNYNYDCTHASLSYTASM